MKELPEKLKGQWNSMSTPPDEWEIVQLLIPKEQIPSGGWDDEAETLCTRSVGFQDSDGVWCVVGWSWTHDYFTSIEDSEIAPVGWMPLNPLRPQSSKSESDSDFSENSLPLQGWKWVPVEPTPEMLDAGDDAIRDIPKPTNRYESPVPVKVAYYRAMLSAAPTPTTNKEKKELTQAALDVMSERRRQVEEEGYSEGLDDLYLNGELARAAASYALFEHWTDEDVVPWPWSAGSFKPSSERENLVKAGALILAEIERLDRKWGEFLN